MQKREEQYGNVAVTDLMTTFTHYSQYDVHTTTASDQMRRTRKKGEERMSRISFALETSSILIEQRNK